MDSFWLSMMYKRVAMKVTTLLATLGVLGVACAFAVQNSPHLEVGKDAPSFAGTASDGKDYSLKSLTAEGPAFVVFWKKRCPHNGKASALFNALHKAHGVNLVGLVNASDEDAKAWVTQFDLSYPLLADAEKKTIGAYAVKYSICTFQISKEGKIEKVFPGYGKESMEALNAAMTSVSGKKVEVDLSSAPGALAWG